MIKRAEGCPPIRLLFAYRCAGTTPVFQTDLKCKITEL